jgi:RNA polymerase sigma factor (sigma-70 family)
MPDRNGSVPAAQVDVLRLLADLFGSLRAPSDVARRQIDARQTIAERLAARTRRQRLRYDVSGREAPPSPVPDVVLAGRALEGDSDAVKAIWNSVQGIVVGRIYAMGLSRYEDELTELVMARIWDKLALYKGSAQASLRTWAWTVTGNALRNWIRDQKTRRRVVSIDEGEGPTGNLAAPDRFAADYDLVEAERQARCRHMLDRIARVAADTLRPEEWTLVQRVVVRGERYDSIAAELGELPGTLRARVFRALNRLRGPLIEELGDDAKEYFAQLADRD